MSYKNKGVTNVHTVNKTDNDYYDFHTHLFSFIFIIIIIYFFLTNLLYRYLCNDLSIFVRFCVSNLQFAENILR